MTEGTEENDEDAIPESVLKAKWFMEGILLPTIGILGIGGKIGYFFDSARSIWIQDDVHPVSIVPQISQWHNMNPVTPSHDRASVHSQYLYCP